MNAESKNLLQARGIIGLHKAQLAMGERIEAGQADSERFAKLAAESSGPVRAKYEEAASAASELERAALSAGERVEFEEMKTFVRGELEAGEIQIAERQREIAEGAETLKTLRSEVSAAKAGGIPTGGGGGGILNAYNGIRDPEARAKFYAEHKAEIRAAIRR